MHGIINDAAQLKNSLHIARHHILQSRPWNKVIVHRVYPLLDPHVDKFVVIDDFSDRFADDKYVRIDSSEAYVIRPTDDVTPQFHILVYGNNARLPPNEEIENLMQTNRSTIVDYDWYCGAVVYNVFNVGNVLPQMLASVDEKIYENVINRIDRGRGPSREGMGKMVGFGALKNAQDGEVSRWRNYRDPDLNENDKYILDLNGDKAFDFVVTVFYFNLMLMC